MKAALIRKLARIRENPASREFILADAKDADMAWGVPSAGEIYPRMAGRGRYRTMPAFHEQIPGSCAARNRGHSAGIHLDDEPAGAPRTIV